MGEEVKILEEISHKLDQLISLLKLSNFDALNKVARGIMKDKVTKKILELTADGSLSYSNLAKKVSDELGVAEITVKRKISRLRKIGLLIPKRRGKEVYYENSGLLD